MSTLLGCLYGAAMGVAFLVLWLRINAWQRRIIERRARDRPFEP